MKYAVLCSQESSLECCLAFKLQVTLSELASYLLILLCLSAETELGQRLQDMDAAQQLKLRERQRFFEEVFQHDVDVYLSSAHLCIRDYKRRELNWCLFAHKCMFTYRCMSFHCLPSPAAPIGSVSSMEVNVDLLDQMELIDISDQEALDVFFSSGGEEGVLPSPLPGMETCKT